MLLFRGVAQRPEHSIDNRAMSVQFLPPRPKSLPIFDCQLPIGRKPNVCGFQSAIINWQSAMSLRDGVTGNTSGFELEDEGSTPSPAANRFTRNRVLRLITSEGISIWRW